MNEINPASELADVIARAEGYLNSGHIRTSRCGPPPKREGRGRNRGKGRAFEWFCRHVAFDGNPSPSVSATGSNDALMGCGRGRYRDQATQRCRGPADLR
jgi:hypothetical protein